MSITYSSHAEVDLVKLTVLFMVVKFLMSSML